MKESKVLVLGLTNCCTELSRHLILSGINLDLVSLQKDELVSQEGYQDEFLVSQEDAGKVKGAVIVQKLSEMNPFSKVAFKETSISELKDVLN